MKEKEILTYMEKLGISREEAEQLWEDDHEDYVSPEMAEMERKAKQIKRYEKADAPRKKSTKERKVDNDKKYLLELLISAINEQNCIDSVKNEAEFSFTFNENSYTVKLVKHRAPKQAPLTLTGRAC